MADSIALPEGFVLDRPSFALPEGFVLDAEQLESPVQITGEVQGTAEDPGLIDRLGTILEERTAIKDRIVSQLQTGEISTASGVLQLVGKVGAATVSEAIGEAVSSGIDVAGDILSAITPDVIEEPIKAFGVSALNTVLESDLGKAGIDAAKSGFDAWEGFKEENPEAAGNIEAVVDIGALIAPAKFVKVGKVGDIGKLTKEQIKNAPSGSDLREASGKLFEATKRSDLNLNQETFLDFLSDAEKMLVGEGIDEVLHPKLSRIVNNLSKKIGQDLGAQDLLNMRRRINVAVDSLEPDEQRLALKLRDNFDDLIEEAPGSESWREARRVFAQARRTETVEEAIERAALAASGVENGLRNEFRALLKNKKKIRGFSKSEKAAMQAIVDGDFTANALKKLGRLSFGSGQQSGFIGGTVGVMGGSAVGGPVGAAAVPLLGLAAQKGAQRRTANAAETLRALTAGETPNLIPKTTVSLKKALAAEAGTGLASIQRQENE